MSLRASSQTGVAICFFACIVDKDSHDSDIGHCLGMTVGYRQADTPRVLVPLRSTALVIRLYRRTPEDICRGGRLCPPDGECVSLGGAAARFLDAPMALTPADPSRPPRSAPAARPASLHSRSPDPAPAPCRRCHGASETTDRPPRLRLPADGRRSP